MDLNNDQALDLLICDAFGMLRYYSGKKGNPLELNQPIDVFQSSGDYMAFYPTDWDGDGLIDILVMDKALKLLKNIGTKSSPKFKTKNLATISCISEKGYEANFKASGVSHERFDAADFNNDGLCDIIVAVETNTKVDGTTFATADISIYYNVGTKEVPAFSYAYKLYDKSKPPLGINGNAKTQLGVVDINGDGTLDIVATETYTSPIESWSLILFEGVPGSTKIQNSWQSSNGYVPIAFNFDKQYLSFEKEFNPDLVSLYSATGKMIHLTQINGSKWELPITLAKGPYLLVSKSASGETNVHGKILR